MARNENVNIVVNVDMRKARRDVQSLQFRADRIAGGVVGAGSVGAGILLGGVLSGGTAVGDLGTTAGAIENSRNLSEARRASVAAGLTTSPVAGRRGLDNAFLDFNIPITNRDILAGRAGMRPFTPLGLGRDLGEGRAALQPGPIRLRLGSRNPEGSDLVLGPIVHRAFSVAGPGIPTGAAEMAFVRLSTQARFLRRAMLGVSARSGSPDITPSPSFANRLVGGASRSASAAFTRSMRFARRIPIPSVRNIGAGLRTAATKLGPLIGLTVPTLGLEGLIQGVRVLSEAKKAQLQDAKLGLTAGRDINDYLHESLQAFSGRVGEFTANMVESFINGQAVLSEILENAIGPEFSIFPDSYDQIQAGQGVKRAIEDWFEVREARAVQRSKKFAIASKNWNKSFEEALRNAKNIGVDVAKDYANRLKQQGFSGSTNILSLVIQDRVDELLRARVAQEYAKVILTLRDKEGAQGR